MTEDTQEEKKPERKEQGFLGFAAEYVMTGLGGIVGLAAEHNAEVKEGLEQVIKFNYDMAMPTAYKIAEVLPYAVNEQALYGLVGLGCAKVVADVAKKAVDADNNPKYGPDERLGHKLARWGTYYAALTIGMAYGANQEVFQNVVEKHANCLEPFVEAAKNPQTYSMWLGAAGMMAFYGLVQKPAFRMVARIAYFANKILNGEWRVKQ